MGFTVFNYSLLGLQNQNFYVTIKGSYQVRKIESLMPGDNSASMNVPSLTTPYYTITFSVYFKASANAPVINDQYMSFNIQALPNPAVLYLIIYDNVKGQLDPYYNTEQQTLVYTDD
jgi:hypothetical protein